MYKISLVFWRMLELYILLSIFSTKNLERYRAWGSVWGSIVGSVGGLLGVPFGGMLGVDNFIDFNMFDTFFFDKTFLELLGGSAIFHFSEK